MKILALEFSSPQRSVAIFHRSSQGSLLSGEAMEIGGKETRAIAMIESALREAALEREQIECLAVGIGPGSYTGVRSAIALAQGWELARPVKLLAVGSDEVLAAQAQRDGIAGRVSIVIDAQRKEFYVTTFEITSQRCERVEPLRLASAEEIRTVQQAGQIIAGPDAAEHFEAGRRLFPGAATLAALASTRTDFMSGETIQPIYLRQTSFTKAPPSRILPEN